MDQARAIELFQSAWRTREAARDNESRMTVALDDAKRTLASAERAVVDSRVVLDAALCGQERSFIEREMAAVNDRALGDLAKLVR